MEKIFEEWANEKTMRIRLEGNLDSLKRQHRGMIRRICGDILEIQNSRTNNHSVSFAVLWLPVRVTGWLVYIPVKLGSVSISTYAYLIRKTMSVAGGVVEGVLAKAKCKLMIGS